jgi:hypothetical protein
MHGISSLLKKSRGILTTVRRQEAEEFLLIRGRLFERYATAGRQGETDEVLAGWAGRPGGAPAQTNL